MVLAAQIAAPVILLAASFGLIYLAVDLLFKDLR